MTILGLGQVEHSMSLSAEAPSAPFCIASFCPILLSPLLSHSAQPPSVPFCLAPFCPILLSPFLSYSAQPPTAEPPSEEKPYSDLYLGQVRLGGKNTIKHFFATFQHFLRRTKTVLYRTKYGDYFALILTLYRTFFTKIFNAFSHQILICFCTYFDSLLH